MKKWHLATRLRLDRIGRGCVQPAPNSIRGCTGPAGAWGCVRCTKLRRLSNVRMVAWHFIIPAAVSISGTLEHLSTSSSETSSWKDFRKADGKAGEDANRQFLSPDEWGDPEQFILPLFIQAIGKHSALMRVDDPVFLYSGVLINIIFIGRSTWEVLWERISMIQFGAPLQPRSSIFAGSQMMLRSGWTTVSIFSSLCFSGGSGRRTSKGAVNTSHCLLSKKVEMIRWRLPDILWWAVPGAGDICTTFPLMSSTISRNCQVR